QTYSPTELIYEIMAGAPPNWQTILRLAEVDTWEDFQNQVRYYEDTLIQQDNKKGKSHRSSSKLIGAHKDNPKPCFPPAHNVKSKGKSPAEKGARPCTHCGADHWDHDCPHTEKNRKFVRAHLATLDEDALDSWENYDEPH
ncbi:hypothetical protein BDV93DRAFT_421160, partial [Ceratobasidium sp. AG-I]